MPDVKKAGKNNGRRPERLSGFYERPWVFFFARDSTTTAYGKSDVRWATLRRCHFHFPSRSTWSRLRMGERLHRDCPVSGPRRPREENRPEPIVSAGSQMYRNGPSSDEDCVWSGWLIVSQLKRSYRFSSSVRSSGILSRVGRTSIFLLFSSFSFLLPSSPSVPLLHFSLSTTSPSSYVLSTSGCSSNVDVVFPGYPWCASRGSRADAHGGFLISDT